MVGLELGPEGPVKRLVDNVGHVEYASVVQHRVGGIIEHGVEKAENKPQVVVSLGDHKRFSLCLVLDYADELDVVEVEETRQQVLFIDGLDVFLLELRRLDYSQERLRGGEVLADKVVVDQLLVGDMVQLSLELVVDDVDGVDTYHV